MLYSHGLQFQIIQFWIASRVEYLPCFNRRVSIFTSRMENVNHNTTTAFKLACLVQCGYYCVTLWHCLLFVKSSSNKYDAVRLNVVLTGKIFYLNVKSSKILKLQVHPVFSKILFNSQCFSCHHVEIPHMMHVW